MEKKNPLRFIAAKTADELPDRKQKVFYITWSTAALLLSSLGICLFSLLLAIGWFPIDVFIAYLKSPAVFLLNWLPVLLIQLFLFLVLGRQWLSFLLTSIFVLGCSVANYYKMTLRYDPLFFSDLRLAGEALGVASDFSLAPNTRIIACAVYIVLGTAVLFFLAKGRPRRLRTRLISAGAVLLSVLPLWSFVYSNSDLYERTIITDYYMDVTMTQRAYIAKGFVYPFLYSIKTGSGAPPEGYSKREAAQLLAEYSNTDIPADRKVNILVFQLEAFCNLEALGVKGIAPEAYELYHSLEKESYTGNLIVNVYGGTTIDTERCFLSGSYLLNNHFDNAYSNVRYLKGQGYSVVGNHPYISSFFSRGNVNRSLGFESYRFYDDYFEQVFKSEGWFPDNYFMPEVLDQYLELSRDGQSVFSFNVTTQTHGPYERTAYKYDQLYWDGQGYSDQARYIINNYLGSVRDTQEHIMDMVNTLRTDSEPVILLLYGDHKPWMGNSASVLHELGININPSTPDGLLNYYSTKYLIWANDAAREVLGDDLAGDGPDVSAGFLMNLLFERLGWEGSDFIQFGNDIRRTLSVITSNGYYYEDGSFTASLSPKGQEAFRKMSFVNYYVNHNYDLSAFQ